jgi:hypothetical protein
MATNGDRNLAIDRPAARTAFVLIKPRQPSFNELPG